jgi:hypothetical protein
MVAKTQEFHQGMVKIAQSLPKRIDSPPPQVVGLLKELRMDTIDF